MSYTQDHRKFALQTPLGKDALLFKGLRGSEGLSRLFSFEIEALAENSRPVKFDDLLGQPLTVRMKMGQSESPCYLNGICARVSQRGRDHSFTVYRLEMVPRLWLLARRTRSRIFQHLSVPDILRKVLEGMNAVFQVQGTFDPRDYCVQYRETDFDFASRLMEEEGLFYFFKHADGEHVMVVADNKDAHPDLPGPPELIYDEAEGGTRDEERIHAWEKVQELRSGACTLWDHCFELPHKHLEAREQVQPVVPVGSVTHKLQLAGNQAWELYDFPGGYARRFDGVDRGGGDRPADLQKLFTDNRRTAKLRIEEEAAWTLRLHGRSTARHLRPGHRFRLKRHWNGDGKYVVLETRHQAEQTGDYRSGADPLVYQASFTCIPFDLPFRPPRLTAQPVVRGPQTAVVVGPAGEEIFPDKYGRVKVQFHWDREGQSDLNSSCWVRVATSWAGRQWGAVHLPRVGQEVVVDFLEGNPDEPIVTGSVYNADMMPPYPLPAQKTVSGLRSRSTPQGGADNFNEIRFDDKKGAELVSVQAEKDMRRLVKNDDALEVRHDQTLDIRNARTCIVQDGNDSLTLAKGSRTVTLDLGNHRLHLKAGSQTTKLDAGASTLEAMQSIELKVGPSSLRIDPSGVKISGPAISIEGTATAALKSPTTQISGDALLTLQGGLVKIN